MPGIHKATGSPRGPMICGSWSGEHVAEGSLYQSYGEVGLILLEEAVKMSRIVQCSGILRLFLIGLCPLLVVRAQQEIPPPATPAGLEMSIVEGGEGLKNIRKGSGTSIVVEVRDRNKVPVSGAIVAFALPEFGPTGAFANGGKLLTVLSDATGRAVMVGMTPGAQTGAFNISATASFPGLESASMLIPVKSVAVIFPGIVVPPLVKLLVVAAVAAAATTGAVVVVKDRDNPPSRPAVRIGLGGGPVSVGPPR